MSRIERKTALPVLDIVKEWMRDSPLREGLTQRLVCDAWDEVSGASSRTVRLFFRGGILYVTLNSSVARASLSARVPEMIREINEKVRAHSLYVGDDGAEGPVKEIRLK